MASYDVILVECGANKLDIVKILRAAIKGLDLQKAKVLIETHNAIVKTMITKDEAEKLKGELEYFGANVKLLEKQEPFANYKLYLEALGHTTSNIVTEKIVPLENKIKSLALELNKKKQENYELSEDIKKQSDVNVRLKKELSTEEF